MYSLRIYLLWAQSPLIAVPTFYNIVTSWRHSHLPWSLISCGYSYFLCHYHLPWSLILANIVTSHCHTSLYTVTTCHGQYYEAHVGIMFLLKTNLWEKSHKEPGVFKQCLRYEILSRALPCLDEHWLEPGHGKAEETFITCCKSCWPWEET